MSKAAGFCKCIEMKKQLCQQLVFLFSHEVAKENRKVILSRSLKNEKSTYVGFFYLSEIWTCSGIEVRIKKNKSLICNFSFRLRRRKDIQSCRDHLKQKVHYASNGFFYFKKCQKPQVFVNVLKWKNNCSSSWSFYFHTRLQRKTER